MIRNFNFSNNFEKIDLPPGRYKLECWGAQGGGYNVKPLTENGVGGQGGYSHGILTLQTTTVVYVYVGGMGDTSQNGFAFGGFNGGGSAWGLPSSSHQPGSGGGGGTDIRIGSNSTYARVIVAGGGGGGGEDSYYRTGGYGGGLTGGKNSANIASSIPGTQTGSGSGGDFFSGDHTDCQGGGGGGVWYGGGVRNGRNTPYSSSIGQIADTKGGSGGSGFVYTSETYKNYPQGCLLNPSFYLEEAETVSGNENIPEPDGSTNKGHTCHGYARITALGVEFEGLIYIYTSNDKFTPFSGQNLCKDSIEIPSTVQGFAVESISENSFFGNTCIKKVTIPTSILSIGDEAFESTTSLQTVLFTETSKCRSLGKRCFFGSYIQTITIPKSVESFGTHIFMSSAIKEVLFESKCQITEFPEWCFHESMISRIIIPVFVETIGKMSFSSTNLDEFSFARGSSISTIDDFAFYNSSLSGITIPYTITSFGPHSFEMSSVSFFKFESLSSLDHISYKCFCNSSLSEIEIPSSVKSIGEMAFESSLVRKISFDSSSLCRNLSVRSFFNCSMASLSLPPSIASLGRECLSHCAKLRRLSYCSGVVQSDSSVVSDTPNLQNVSVPFFYTYDSFCGLPITKIDVCEFSLFSNLKCRTEPINLYIMVRPFIISHVYVLAVS